MTAARRDAKPSPATAPVAPPYYIATAPLYIGGKFGRAFNPGDRVPPEHVEQYGWQAKVRLPDGYTPDQPQGEPETPDGGQATTSDGKDV